jgi:hypothetical protein
VAVKYNGAYGNYGSVCQITTPSATFATTRLNAVHCGTTLTSKWNVLYCGQVIGATAYRFTLTNGTTSLSTISTTNSMQLGNVVGYTLNTTYSVTVAVQINGGWGNEGAACSITSPATTARLNSETEQAFTVLAIPNPFNTDFVLMPKGSSKSPIQAQVFDMTGRLVETISSQWNTLQDTNIGTNYASGVYNIAVTQDDTTQIVRVVKR